MVMLQKHLHLRANYAELIGVERHLPGNAGFGHVGRGGHERTLKFSDPSRQWRERGRTAYASASGMCQGCLGPILIFIGRKEGKNQQNVHICKYIYIYTQIYIYVQWFHIAY